MSELDVREVTGTVVCDEEAASCRCREPAGHAPATPHRCPCGGSWKGVVDTETFEIVALPPLRVIPSLNFKDVW